MLKSVRFCYLFIVLCFAAAGLVAQDKPISGGVLNGKAISLPKPAYPAISKAACASGTVGVQVMIDESGNVIAARAVSGHPLLQAAAVRAAQEAKFSPTFLNGVSVKVTGVINYNFVLDTSTKITADGEERANPCAARSAENAYTEEANNAGLITGGVLNGKALKLAKPAYPAEAKEAGVAGAVKVRVVIDEEGKVISANAISGPEQLYAASVEAALASKFSPTTLSGQPVKISGYIVYNFAPSNK
jgi:TonB family protein